jgi:hypothetical protein
LLAEERISLGNIFTPQSTVHLVKLTGFHSVKIFPTFYETRRFITAFTSTLHLSIPWRSSIWSMPPLPTNWSLILILLSHRRLGFPGDLYASGFPTKLCIYTYISNLSHTSFMPYHLILFDLITGKILRLEYRSFGSLLCRFFQSLLNLFLFGPNNLRKKLSPNTICGLTYANKSNCRKCL